MKFLIVFVSLFAYIIAKPATSIDNQRYFIIPDEDGKLHIVDIQAIPRFYDPIDYRNVTFQLYTKQNPEVPLEFNPNELDVLIESGLFDPSFPTLFNTHGWTGVGTSTHLIAVKDALLAKYDFNIINIDWSGPSHTFYTIAIQYIDTLGDIIGEFINSLIDHYDIDASAVGLMGHSLGGQLVARVGYATSGKLGYLIALDPAFPSFNTDDLSKRLDSADASFVQVIHANSGMLGVSDSVGHADFHLNGGRKQPDCGADLIGTCSHFLIKDMVAESYTGVYKGWRCNSYEEYLIGDCANNPTSYWAGWPVDTTARGDYHLETRGSPPFIIN